MAGGGAGLDWGSGLGGRVPTWKHGTLGVWCGGCQGVVVSTQLCQDLIRAKKFVRELLGWPGHTKELGLNVDSAADLEFWSGSSSGVGG